MSEGKSVKQVVLPFALGGLSGMGATCVIQPLDMIKVRIQLTGEAGSAANANPFSTGANIIRTEGVGGLYRGLSAALFRQATYTTARLGIYQNVYGHFQSQGNDSFTYKAISGLTAGGIGSMFGTPADVALIRMQADATLPEAQRRGYKNVVDALVKIGKAEGLNGFFKGNVPVVFRAMALNVGMLATHDQAKDTLKNYINNSTALYISAKFTAGFFASALSLPFDFLKTRMQKQVRNADGSYPYRNALHAAGKIMAEEGPLAFYRGFFTYYIRIAPHAMITLVCLDLLKKVPIFKAD
jgi:solute carrier family 25 oxoglutarate transporter 11